MQDKDRDREVKEVQREERSRGRRPIDTEQEGLTKKFKRDFEELLLNANKAHFKAFLIAYGQLEGSEQFEISMKLWKGYQQNRHNRP